MNHEAGMDARQVQVFFLVVSFIYIYPFVHADYAYIDDSWRSLLLADDAWRNQGRILLEFLHRVLTFSSVTVNIFPLPLFISTAAMAWAMSRLTLHYFPQPQIPACLVVLPLLCNPFFLGNLSYQYDGPGMLLALVALVYGITFNAQTALMRWLVATVLIAIALSLYQLTITVFIGLCAVEFVAGVKEVRQAKAVLSQLGQRVLQLIGGAVLYFCTAYQFVIDHRGDFQITGPERQHIVIEKMLFTLDKVSLLSTAGNGLVCLALLTTAALGYLMLSKNIWNMPSRTAGKSIVAILYIGVIPVLILCIPGAMLVVAEPNLDARNFIGFAGGLVFVFLLSYEALGRLGYSLRWLLIVPVLCMFSLCYAYGQVLVAKKELESAMGHYLAYDLSSNKAFATIKGFYFIGPMTGENWLPRAHGAITHAPILRYFLSNSSVLLRIEFLPRLGINNARPGRREMLDASLVPVVDGKFYQIYVTGDKGYIVMKEITDSEDFTEPLPFQ
ncbi:glucosyltransferase domain-containing protein [Pseudomonas poae]|uniref:Glucosyl transferase GtrII n=1 Tax=Pseudomonas poae TaxID=200451 RepID=A0A2S9EVD8_9PSED|nr:glucosyltransferase domain-containing protein [Pseudomonas poae]PRA29216.1 hypothetical protein CQZ97_12875 [Pseudomonas poae]PRC20144.1 hypothetical protein CQZ99_09170 [Pseudomonas poae]